MLKSVSNNNGSRFWSRWVRRISIATGIYAIVGGILTLFGWSFGIERLMAWSSSGITMKANAAICSILLGSSLIFAVNATKFRVPIRLLAGMATLIAAQTLFEHLFGINTGIDTLLFDEPAGALATAAPGRMGPPAATTFTMLGIALLLTTGPIRARRAAGWIGVLVFIISTLPLLGYVYGASQLYGIARFTGIAFQTATMIAALSIGVVTVVKEFGLIELIEGESAGSVMFRRMALPLTLVSIMVGWIRVIGQDAGLYDTAFGTAARTIVEILVILGLLWWTARGITRAEQILRDADRRKDEFIATLSHELRNPLAPIRSAVEVLRHGGSGPSELSVSRDMIDRQVTHMTRLIDDLLDVGRITQNKVELRKETIDMGDMVRQAVETARPLLEERRHRLSLELPTKPVYLDADPVRITQILANLLNNACKFTEPNGEILLLADPTDTDVEVTVRDNGKGISRERISSVFEMFTQVDGAAGVDHSGLGIGLNLTKHLVELHGGTIEVTSDGEGRGSTFTVRLPRIPGLAAPIVQEQVSRNGNSARKLRILVVDDNEDAAESLRMMMALDGNETEIANDGHQAVELAKVFRPNVVLLDIGMPGMDGYDVCRAIRKEAWGSDIYIAALTGWGQDEDRRRTKEAGFDTHLVKPVDPLALLEMISTLGLSGTSGR